MCSKYLIDEVDTKIGVFKFKIGVVDIELRLCAPGYQAEAQGFCRGVLIRTPHLLNADREFRGKTPESPSL